MDGVQQYGKEKKIKICFTPCSTPPDVQVAIVIDKVCNAYNCKKHVRNID
jgi:hypothetical protein